MVNPVRNLTQIKANKIVSNGVKKTSLAVLFLLLAPNLLFSVEPLQRDTGGLAVNFTLAGLDNKTVSLSDFKDKPIILFFWTTWCPFCGQELEIFADNYEKLKKEGLELLAINIGESFAKVDNFTKGRIFPFPILLDQDENVAYSYGILGVPTYVFIDNKGRIVSREHNFSEKMYKGLISK